MPLLRAEFRRYARLLKPPLFHDRSQVLYLPFDKDDGAYARDRSGYNNHGTLKGPTRVRGVLGNAIDFDGVNDRLDVDFLSADTTFSAFTIDTLIKFKTLANYEAIPTSVDWGPLGGFIVFRSGTSFGLRLCDYPYTTEITLNITPAVTTDVWYHVTWTFSRPNLKVYLNGIFDNGKTWNHDLYHTGRLSWSLWDYWANVTQDNFRFYKRELSAAEVLRLVNMRGL